MKAAGMPASRTTASAPLAFRDVIGNDGAFQAHPVGDLTGALAVIQYTGGTTGAPKGAMLTHANLSGACAQYLETTRVGPNPLIEGEERTLCVLPLFHIYALSVLLVLGPRLGAEIVLHPRIDAPAALKDIVLKKITVYVGVPMMHIAMLNLPDVKPASFSSIKQCSNGVRSSSLATMSRASQSRDDLRRQAFNEAVIGPPARNRARCERKAFQFRRGGQPYIVSAQIFDHGGNNRIATIGPRALVNSCLNDSAPILPPERPRVEINLQVAQMLPARFAAARVGLKFLRLASDLRRYESQHLGRRRFLMPLHAAWKPQVGKQNGEPEQIGGAPPLADQRHVLGEKV